MCKMHILEKIPGCHWLHRKWINETGRKIPLWLSIFSDLMSKSCFSLVSATQIPLGYHSYQLVTQMNNGGDLLRLVLVLFQFQNLKLGDRIKTLKQRLFGDLQEMVSLASWWFLWIAHHVVEELPSSHRATATSCDSCPKTICLQGLAELGWHWEWFVSLDYGQVKCKSLHLKSSATALFLIKDFLGYNPSDLLCRGLLQDEMVLTLHNLLCLWQP